MKQINKYILLISLLFFVKGLSFSQTSPFAEGHWVKVAIEESGVYKLPFDTLRAWGFDDPEHIGVYGSIKKHYSFCEDTLPKFKEIPMQRIKKNGENSYRLYFKSVYISQYYKGVKYSNLLRTDIGQNYYYIKQNSEKYPLEIDSLISTYQDEEYTIKHLGKRTFSWLNGIEGGHALRKGDYIVYPQIEYLDTVITNSETNFSYRNNLQLMLDKRNQDSIAVQINEIIYKFAPSSSILFEFPYTTTIDSFKVLSSNPNSTDVLERISISVYMPNSFDGYQSHYSLNNYNQGLISLLGIANNTPKPTAWYIDENSTPHITNTTKKNDTLIIEHKTELSYNTYVCFSADSLTCPTFSETISNIDVLNLTPAKNLIITADHLYKQGLEIADIHEKYDNISSLVIKQTDIYNMYSNGMPFPCALHHFCADMFKKSQTKGERIEFITLLGDGKRDLVYINTDTEIPLAVPDYCGDSFIGVLEDTICSAQDILFLKARMSVAVGRIPAKNTDEANIYIDKLRKRYQSLKHPNRQHLVISDRYETYRNSSFIDTLERHVTNSPIDYPEIVTHKIYRKNSDNNDSINKEIVNYLYEGVGLLTYSGHSYHLGWNDSIMPINKIMKLKNRHCPVVVSESCEYASLDRFSETAAQHWLFNPRGGAIALIGVMAPIGSDVGTEFLSSFYRSWKNRNDIILGEVYKEAWNVSRSLMKPFIILGDPIISFKYPESTFAVNRDDNRNISTAVLSNKVVNTNFNGSAQLIIYSAPFEKTIQPTNEKYEVLDSIIYKSISEVINGKASFIVPRSLDKSQNIHLSALSNDSTEEAYQVYSNFTSFVGNNDEDITINNPFDNKLFLKSDLFVNQNIRVSIIALDGRVVLNNTYAKANNNLEIETTHLAPSCYILNIKGDIFNYNRTMLKTK